MRGGERCEDGYVLFGQKTFLSVHARYLCVPVHAREAPGEASDLIVKAGYRQRRGGCLKSEGIGRYGYRPFRVWEVIPMDSKAYCARKVNQVTSHLDLLIKAREGQDLWAGVDVGKYEMQLVLHWGAGEFERPWKICNPQDIALVVEMLKRLSVGRKLVVAMEPSGTYGDAFRQAVHDAGLVMHRVHPKVAHDYAEVFDGVPSQHDGKDAAVVAELCRCGKSKLWSWKVPDQRQQQIEYQVDRMDAHRRLWQMWSGRLEARLARHWPEVLWQLKLTSPTLLKALIEYGGPAGLAADAEAEAKLKRWGRAALKPEMRKRLLESVRTTRGVRQHAMDVQRVKDYATAALAAREQVKTCQKALRELSRGFKPVEAMGSAVGLATACVLWTALGDPGNYHCGEAYVKAMGLNLTERSSGVYKGRLKISKRGSGMVRYWMYLAALRLVQKHSPVRPWYLKKKQKDSERAGKALVAIMRKLALGLYHAGALGELFEASRLFPGAGKALARKGG